MNVLHTFDDLNDFIRGLTLLGTGGGGRPEAGYETLSPYLKRGDHLRWSGVEAISDNSYYCSLSGLGSIAPTTPMSVEDRVASGYPREMDAKLPMLLALRELERQSNKKISGVFPVEIGAGNTTTTLATALAAGIEMIDCDCAGGRAIPEMSQSSLALSGVSFTPAAFADPWGSVISVSNCHSNQQAERIGKAISSVTKLPDMRAQCARAAFIVDGKTLKQVANFGSVSRALRLGKAIGEARTAGQDPVGRAAKELNGVVVCRGTLTEKNWQSRDGYMFGELCITTEENAKVRIFVKNENHIVWINDAPKYTAPDLICVVQAKTGEPFTNTAISTGESVAVVVAPAVEMHREAKYVDALGPRHYGFEIDYLPIRKAS